MFYLLHEWKVNKNAKVEKSMGVCETLQYYPAATKSKKDTVMIR